MKTLKKKKGGIKKRVRREIDTERDGWRSRKIKKRRGREKGQRKRPYNFLILKYYYILFEKLYWHKW